MSQRLDPYPEGCWQAPNKGMTSGARNIPPAPPGSSVRHEPITYPLARYFSPHETEEYKA